MMLEARDLECVRGHRRLFTNLSFSMHPGNGFELRGPNGSGKTSLLRMLCGLLPPTSGSILWNGEPISALGERYRASVTYVGHRRAVASLPELAVRLRWAFAASAAASLVVPLVIGEWRPLVSRGLLLALWMAMTTGVSLRETARTAGGWRRMASRRPHPRSYYGMQLAHVGVAVSIAGITIVTACQWSND